MAVKIQTSMDFCFRKPLLPDPSKRLCRNLFGKVDHEELQEEYKDLISKETTEKKSIWDFDFEAGCPLPSRRLRWEPVTKGVSSFGIGSSVVSCSLSRSIPDTKEATIPEVEHKENITTKTSASTSTLRIVNENEVLPSSKEPKLSPPKVKSEAKPERRKRETTITEFMKQRKKRRYSDVEKSQKSDSMEPPRARTRLSVSHY